MKRLLLTVLILIAGCGSASRKHVLLHPQLGTQCMKIPAGAQVGKYKAPADGVFMTDTVLFGLILEIVSESEVEFKAW